jgi:acetyltransferase
MQVVAQMKKFIEPESVVLFGVSRRTGEVAYNILEHLLSYGYRGKIYPVNPNASEILGMKTYSCVADISDEIDLAIINLPRPSVIRIVKECAEKGIKSIIIATQGFVDANDEEGKRLQKKIDGFVEKGEVRILGPNSLGIVNPFINFSSSFTRVRMAKVPIGIICQTGAFFGFDEPKLIGKGVDLGNACDVHFTDSMEYFEQDAETKVVALHIEGVQDGSRFIEAVKRLARRKPVVTLKTGRSEYAAQAVQSHTGSLAGTDEVWEVALRQSGAIRVDNLEELGDVTAAFSLLPPMNGRRIGIISSSGGLGVAAIDTCHQFDMEIAQLSQSTMKQVNALSPPWQSVGNPVDIWPAFIVQKHPLTKVLTGSVGAVLNDDEVDAALLIWGVTSRQTCARLCQILTRLAEVHRNKPLVCSLWGAHVDEAKDSLEATGRIMVTRTPDRAIRALAHLARYSAVRRGF